MFSESHSIPCGKIVIALSLCGGAWPGCWEPLLLTIAGYDSI